MTSKDVDDLNSRLSPLGYDVEQREDFYFIGFIDPPKRTRLFRTLEDAENVATSIENSEWWRLDLNGGSVNFDRDKKLVTPLEGDERPEPYPVNRAGGHSGSGRYTDGRDADFLYFRSKDHPPLGGRWHKWGSLF